MLSVVPRFGTNRATRAFGGLNSFRYFASSYGYNENQRWGSGDGGASSRQRGRGRGDSAGSWRGQNRGEGGWRGSSDVNSRDGGSFSDRGNGKGTVRGRGSYRGRQGSNSFRGSDDEFEGSNGQRDLSGGEAFRGRAKMSGDASFDREGEIRRFDRGRGRGRGGMRARGNGRGSEGRGNNRGFDQESDADMSRAYRGRDQNRDNNRSGFETSEGGQGSRTRFFMKKSSFKHDRKLRPAIANEPKALHERGESRQARGGSWQGASERGGKPSGNLSRYLERQRHSDDEERVRRDDKQESRGKGVFNYFPSATSTLAAHAITSTNAPSLFSEAGVSTTNSASRRAKQANANENDDKTSSPSEWRALLAQDEGMLKTQSKERLTKKRAEAIAAANGKEATAYKDEQKNMLRSLENNEKFLNEEKLSEKPKGPSSYKEEQIVLLDRKLARGNNREMKRARKVASSENPEIRGEIIYGTHSVLAALEANKREFYTLYHKETKDVGAGDEVFLKALRLAHKLGVPSQTAPRKLLDNIDAVTNGLLLDCGELPVVTVRAPAENGDKQPILEANAKFEALDADLLRRLLFAQPLAFTEKYKRKTSAAAAAVDPRTTASDHQVNSSSSLSDTSSSLSNSLASLSSSISDTASSSSNTLSDSPASSIADTATDTSAPLQSTPASTLGVSGLSFSAVSPPPVPPLWVALDNVHDHVNIGGIMRSAHFFNCSGVLLGANCCEKLTAAISKNSAGAMECTNLIKVADIARLVHSVSHHFPAEDKWRVVALSLDSNAHDLREFQRDAPTIVLVGNEGEGLRPPVAAACSHAISIKTIPGGVGELDSLNASTATAVALYQLSGSLTQA